MIFYGRNVSQEALKSSQKINTLYLEDSINYDDKIANIVEIAKIRSIPIKKVSNKVLKDISGSSEHQGVLVDVNFKYEIMSEIGNKDSYIYISDFTYEHNLGAIARTAELSGVGGIIIPKMKQVSPVSMKTSAGSLFHIPVFKEAIFNVVKKLKDLNYQIVGIERDGKSFFNIDLTPPTLFIIGGEDKELSTQVRERCDEIAEIPQYGKINSLNMSVAASVVLYERVRQLNI